MSLARYRAGDGSVHWAWMRDGRLFDVREAVVVRCLSDSDFSGLAALASDAAASGMEVALVQDAGSCEDQPTWLAPVVEGMEVWAAGVTYESSKLARISESDSAGDFYAQVYVADRPELFFKSSARGVVGNGGRVRVRADSAWTVPEPELAIVASADGYIVGYTLGNDVSARDIEGANPLYLPQAKVYRGACALGPVIVPAMSIDAQDVTIRMSVHRGDYELFCEETSTSRMRRDPEDLVAWLFRANDYPHGVILLTGTGIVPPDGFALAPGDRIAIESPGIGILSNTVGL